MPRSCRTHASCHGRVPLLASVWQSEVLCTLFGRLALSAEKEECSARCGIRLAITVAFRETLVLCTLGFLEEGRKGGETGNYDGCFRGVSVSLFQRVCRAYRRQARTGLTYRLIARWSSTCIAMSRLVLDCRSLRQQHEL